MGDEFDELWPSQPPVLGGPRYVLVHDELRYAQGANQSDQMLDGYPNYHWLMSPDHLNIRKVMLEAGINAPALTVASDGPRRSLIAIRSSPWKAGHETNPGTTSSTSTTGTSATSETTSPRR